MGRSPLTSSLSSVITILKYLGMWPTYTTLYWLYTILMFVFLQIPIAVLPIATLFMEDDVGVLRIASCIFLNLQVSIVPFKTVLLLIFNKNLLKAVDILNCDAFNSYRETQQNFVKDNTTMIRKIFNYIPLCFITVVLMSLSSLTSIQERELFVEMWFPLNPKTSLFNYFIVYLFSVLGEYLNVYFPKFKVVFYVGVEFCALTNSAVVVLTCGLLINAATQIKILKDNLMNTIDQQTTQHIYPAITNCIQHYSVIIR